MLRCLSFCCSYPQHIQRDKTVAVIMHCLQKGGGGQGTGREDINSSAEGFADLQCCRAHPEGGGGPDVGRGGRGCPHPLRHWGVHCLPGPLQPKPGPHRGLPPLGQEPGRVCHGRGCRCVSVTSCDSVYRVEGSSGPPLRAFRLVGNG